MAAFDASLLDSALDTAQNELEEAEILLLEISARAKKARDEVSRLKTAVAALKGEAAPSEPPKEVISRENTPKEAQTTPNQPQATDSEEDIDAWEANRKKKLAKRAKEREAEERASNPMYDVKCTGCGQAGVLQQSMIKAPSGVPLPAIVCTSCGNMLMS